MMRLVWLLPLAACAPLAAVLDPPLGQLARWEAASDATIAAEPVACPPGHPACARLHARRAQACMTLAMAARAPGAACPGTADHLHCAASGYAAARALAPHPALAQGEAQARLCRTAFLPRAEAAAEAARAREAAALAPVEARPLLRARAALVLSHPRLGISSDSCAAARAGRDAAPPGSPEAQDLGMRIAALPGCADALPGAAP
jgi:hypothetical protein